MDGTGDAAADEHRENQSEYCSNCRHNCRDQYRSLLITHNRRGARIDLRQHVSTNGIELLIEFVAEHVGSFEGISDFREIPRIKLPKQLCILFAQAMAEVVYCGIYPVLDARQRGIVGGRAGVLDDRNDNTGSITA